MKKYTIIVISTILVTVLFFILDAQLFYYGKSDFSLYHSLPLKIKPVFRYDFEGGFALEDEYGFRLISKGDCQYAHSNIKLTIKEIIKYGFTKDRLIAFVEDVNGQKYFIECLKNDNPNINQEMVINVVNEKTLIHSEELQWIEIKNDKSYSERVELIRNQILFVLVILFLLVIYKMYKSRHHLTRVI